MNIHRDFEEFLKLLTEQGVDFVIVGGYCTIIGDVVADISGVQALMSYQGS